MNLIVRNGKIEMPNAFITGTCGFIGSHLAERLVADGWDVSGVDDMSVGNLKNIDTIRNSITFYDYDAAALLRDTCWISDDIDVIFHLAARLGPAQVIADPLTMLRESEANTVAVCELAERTGAILVLASSSEVYGYNTRFVEDEPTLIGPSHLPRCGYAVSKLMMEHVGLAYHRQRGVKTIVVRLFNIVGKRQRERFVLPIFARQALQQQRITVHGEGRQLRSFTHVSDCVEALVRLATNSDAVGQVVNVGSAASVSTIVSAAKDIRAHCAIRYGVPIAKLDYVPYAQTHDAAWEKMAVRIPDTTKLRALTGLEFKDKWWEIVEDVCADQAEQLGITNQGEAA